MDTKALSKTLGNAAWGALGGTEAIFDRPEDRGPVIYKKADYGGGKVPKGTGALKPKEKKPKKKEALKEVVDKLTGQGVGLGYMYGHELIGGALPSFTPTAYTGGSVTGLESSKSSRARKSE